MRSQVNKLSIYLYKSCTIIIGKFFERQNIHQNTPNYTISQNLLGGACLQPPGMGAATIALFLYKMIIFNKPLSKETLKCAKLQQMLNSDFVFI